MARNVALAILDASDASRCEQDFFFCCSSLSCSRHTAATCCVCGSDLEVSLPAAEVCEAGTSAKRSGRKCKRLPLSSHPRNALMNLHFSNMPVIVPQISVFRPLTCFTHNPQVLFLTLSGSSFQLRGSRKRIKPRNVAFRQLSRCRNTEVLDSFWGMFSFLFLLK